MDTSIMKTQAYWSHAPLPRFEELKSDLVVDVLVVGGGITGVSALHLLAAEGLRVALVERGTIASGDTGHTTAHLTYMTDTRLSDLARRSGRRAAQAAWEAGAASMGLIRKTVRALDLDCELAVVPGYLAAAASGESDREADRLKDEQRLAREMGFDLAYLERDPVNGLPSLRFPEQMKFHPRKYLAGVLADALRNGAMVYEQTEVGGFGKGHVAANGSKIHYGEVVIATHVPLQGESGTLGSALFQTKLALYSSYAVSATLPPGKWDEMIWSDTADPFNYLRIDRGEYHDLAILGGEDDKTGQSADTVERYRRLDEKMAALDPSAEVNHRWSGQVVETSDGLPFIGRSGERQFVATGFSGNGMTFGTVAAMMARDAVLGVSNPWAETFDPSRKPFRSLPTYVAENVDFPAHFVGDRFGIPADALSTIAPSQGRVIDYDDEPVAAYRDGEGRVHLHTAVCPHLGCIVAWNEAEQTWDCPCHGSRFRATGEVIAGPAEAGLAAVSTKIAQHR